ncbi:hypothetical protein JCM11641_005637 [Rhodosporidiobolus odoratus]
MNARAVTTVAQVSWSLATRQLQRAMEPEPISSLVTLTAVPAPAEADMTIDYEHGGLDGSGDDAEMGDDAPAVFAKDGQVSLEEAEMVDDEASASDKDAAMVEEEPPVAVDPSMPSSSAPSESAIAVDAPTTGRLDPSVTPAQVPAMPLAPPLEDPGNTAISPSQLVSPSSVALPTLPLEATLAVPPFPPSTISSPDTVAVAQDEPSGATLDATVTAEVATSQGPDATCVERAEPPTAVPESEEAPGPQEAPPSALASASSSESAAKQFEVPESPRLDADPAIEPVTAAGHSHIDYRPLVDKDPLLSIIAPAQPSASSSTTHGVPAVFLSYDNSTFSLFHSRRLLSTDAGEAADEDSPLMLGDPKHHELYHQPVDRLFRAIREQFVEFKDQQDELVLEFDEIGIALGEDNVYCTQVTLFDFDRIHLGCKLPGRLHARLYTQGRFATGFNALAQHVANSSHAADGLEENVDFHFEGGDEEEVEESVTIGGDQEERGEEEDEESEEPRGEEGLADDHDGPDSELVASGENVEFEGGEGARVEGEEDEEGEELEYQKETEEGQEQEPEQEQEQGQQEGDDQELEGEEYGEEDFDLDEALAQLDDDDVVAAVEGAQEDYLLSQQPEEETGGVAGDRQSGEEAGEVGEEAGEAGEDGELAEPEEVATAGHAAEVEGAGEFADADEGHAQSTMRAAGEEPEGGAEQEQEKNAEAEQEQEKIAEVPPTITSETATINLSTHELAEEPEYEIVDTAPPSTEEGELPATEDQASAAVQDGTPSAALPASVEEPEEVGTAVDDVSDESVGATGDAAFAPADETEPPLEEPTDSTDLVIDYDEAFDSGRADVQALSTTAPLEPATAATTAIGKEADEGRLSPPTPLSPKRSRESFLEGEDGGEEVDGEREAGEAKRPRLEDSVPAISA